MTDNQKVFDDATQSVNKIIAEFEQRRGIENEFKYSASNMVLYATNSLPISSLITKYEKNKLIFNDAYQRDYVWTKNRIKSELIKSIVFKLPTGLLTYKKTDNEGFEVLDGQQRIRTVLSFMNVLPKDFEPKRFNLSEDVSRAILIQKYEAFKAEYNAALNTKGETKKQNRFITILNSYNKGENFYLSWFDLPQSLKDIIEEYCFHCIVLDGTFSQKDIKDYFRVIQNQEKLKAAQILKSHDTFKEIYQYLSFEDLTSFCQLLNFNNLKNEVAKILANVILLDQNQTPLNAMDETILTHFNKLKNFQQSQIDFLKTLKTLISYYPKLMINKIYAKEQNTHLFKRFSMKLFFLAELYSQNQKYLQQTLWVKRKLLNKLNSFTKILNSKDVDTKTKDIPNFIRQDVTEIWRLSRTSHKKDNVIHAVQTYFDPVVKYLMENYPKLLKTEYIDTLIANFNQSSQESEEDKLI